MIKSPIFLKQRTFSANITKNPRVMELFIHSVLKAGPRTNLANYRGTTFLNSLV